ncbi:Leucine Rich Repeat [Nesidiocoris tenuis]|uniref:Leucine Rich Repeat n=1 Tax=Nesidiocoris tenuis TaxID=355587 RepID=A0ABN7AHC4_9HEMI|nr:Leucine Rich Repeat [Nesidiocoris tenuis]
MGNNILLKKKNVPGQVEVLIDVSNLETIPKHVNTLSLLNKNITSLHCLNNFKNLKRLFLGGNSISVLEGLLGCVALEELWLDHQRLPPSEALQLDQRTINSLSENLIKLNLSGNHLVSTVPLRALRKLQFLDISQNDLSDLEETVETVAVWKELREIKCDKNPIAKHRFYEAAIVQCNPLLRYFNEKSVTLECRVSYSKLINAYIMNARRSHLINRWS